jgi:hypothetical protein
VKTDDDVEGLNVNVQVWKDSIVPGKRATLRLADTLN